MSERGLRLILAAIMIVTLFLPVDPDPQVPPNWLFSLWYSMELLVTLPGAIIELDIGGLAFGFAYLLYLWAIPLLALWNLWLSAYPVKELKVVYRVFLLVFFLLVWGFVIFIVQPYRGIGYWANPSVVTAAALCEGLQVKGWLEKLSDDEQKEL